jgi:lysozyme
VNVEGERLTAYKDTVGRWTIGVGHTGPEVHQGMTITKQQSRAYLTSDTEAAEKVVLSVVHVPLTDNQRFALVSFVFNLGASRLLTSTLLRKLNAGDYGSVPYELMRWNHETVNGVLRESDGLTNRRAAEVRLWNTK